MFIFFFLFLFFFILATFVVDAKHNNYTVGAYLYDKIKSLIGLTLFNSLFMWGLISIIDWAGPDAWKYT